MFTLKFCSLLIGGAAITGSIALVAVSRPALRDIIYTFDTFTGSGNPPLGPYGTVNLHQNGANLDVTVTLSRW